MGYLYAVLAFVAWAVSATVLLRPLPLSGPAAACLGSAVGAMIILARLGKRRREVVAAFRAYPLRLVGQTVAFAGSGMTYHWAMKTTTVANAALTHSLQPAITSLLFIPFLRRRLPTKVETLSVAVGFVGLYVLLRPQLAWDGSMLGIGLGVLSAVLYSASLMSLVWFMGKASTDVLLACVMLMSVVFMAPFALTQGGSLPADAGSVALLLVYGAAAYAAAPLLYLAAIERIKESHIATLGYIEPLAAIAAGALWLGEPVTASVVIGGALVLASGGIVMLDQKES